MNYTRFLDSLERYVKAEAEYRAAREQVLQEAPEGLRWLRSLCKKGVRAFAKVLELSPSYYSKVERGIEPVSPDLARKLLKETGGRNA